MGLQDAGRWGARSKVPYAILELAHLFPLARACLGFSRVISTIVLVRKWGPPFPLSGGACLEFSGISNTYTTDY